VLCGYGWRVQFCLKILSRWKILKDSLRLHVAIPLINILGLFDIALEWIND